MPLAAQLSPEYRFTPAPALPRLCTSALNRLCDQFWEMRLGVVTTGGAPSPHADAHRYGSLAYHTYFSIFDALGLQPDDVVADLGCGKGRVIFTAAQYPIREAIGVEIDPPLACVAEINRSRLRVRRAPVRVVCQSAVDFDYDPVTVIVLFHPFGADTLRCVLDRLEESSERRPRRLRIVYSNPLLGPLLAARPWLRLAACWQPATWSRIKFPVHFYRSAF